MTDYVKVTLDEFLLLREATESNISHAESASKYSYDEAVRAEKAVRAIEQRNQIEPPYYR